VLEATAAAGGAYRVDVESDGECGEDGVHEMSSGSGAEVVAFI
jgi:hypothetical protein